MSETAAARTGSRSRYASLASRNSRDDCSPMRRMSPRVARRQAVPVHPAGAPADVDGEVGRALDLGDDPHRRHHLAQVRRHGRLEGEHPVAPLLEGDARGVELVVGDDHLLGAGEVLGQQDLGRPRDVLGDGGRQPGDRLADVVELGVERAHEPLAPAAARRRRPRRRRRSAVHGCSRRRRRSPMRPSLATPAHRRRTTGRTRRSRSVHRPFTRARVHAPCGSDCSRPTTGSSTSSTTPRRTSSSAAAGSASCWRPPAPAVTRRSTP